MQSTDFRADRNGVYSAPPPVGITRTHRGPRSLTPLQKLHGWHYRDCGPAFGPGDDPQPLIERGWVVAQPIVYEDFLPVSAAGMLTQQKFAVRKFAKDLLQMALVVKVVFTDPGLI
jgi:hypothetical protein